MRIALISDLHGVLEATERVLADIAQVGVDQIICLGDVTLFGPQPREVLHRVRALGCPVVMGNTDAWALDPQPPAHRDDDSQRYADVEGWGAAMLDEAGSPKPFQETMSRFGSQDAEGRQRLIEAINFVRDKFARIIVITHLEELKDAFSARIEVTKTPNGSQVGVVAA